MGIVNKCRSCGAVFEEPRVVKQRHTELEGYWYEKREVCPYCGIDDIVEMNTCLECGKPIDCGLLCDECSESMINEDTVKDFGAEDKVEVKINSLLTYIYSDEKIEKILLKNLEQDWEYKKILKEFVMDNHDEWNEFIAEKHGLL